MQAKCSQNGLSGGNLFAACTPYLLRYFQAKSSSPTILTNRLPSAQSHEELNAVLQQPECRLIFEKLRTELPEYLHYHTLRHTLDVCYRAAELAIQEGVAPEDMRLLLVAAAYHDSGFLQQALHHEAISCSVAKATLPAYGYNHAELETICSITMATRLPQKPRTLPEKIICDADLDYLGREDFFECGQHLYSEWLQQGLIQNETEWNIQQVDFLKKHHYFTATAIKQRTARKKKNLDIIEQKLIEL